MYLCVTCAGTTTGTRIERAGPFAIRRMLSVFWDLVTTAGTVAFHLFTYVTDLCADVKLCENNNVRGHCHHSA